MPRGQGISQKVKAFVERSGQLARDFGSLQEIMVVGKRSRQWKRGQGSRQGVRSVNKG